MGGESERARGRKATKQIKPERLKQLNGTKPASPALEHLELVSGLQGYLAHKKQPPPLRAIIGP